MDEASMDSTAMGMQMDSMGGMPAVDPDEEFLMMMVDHHAGMVAMGREAMNRASDDSVKTAAQALQEKQLAQQDTMVTMIRQLYAVEHHPTMMPGSAAQEDSLRQTTGIAADRYFLRTRIAHHQEGMAMIDEFMPRFTKPEVREMAEKVRAEQQMEIEELQGKLSSLAPG